MTLNKYLFTETGTDSGALNVLGTVITPFRETGRYRMELFEGDRFLTHRLLVVSEEEPAAQIDLDLASLPERTSARSHDRDCCCDDHKTLRLGKNGYVLLDVSRGPGGFVATITDVDADGEDPEFDTRRLQAGAYFAVTLLRPGEYVARNELDGAEFEFVIPRLDEGDALEVPDDPLRVAVTDRGLEGDYGELQPTQGLIFDIETDARIVVDLLEDEEGERDRPSGRYVASHPL